MDDVPLVKVVDRTENLSNSLCCVLLGELALFANSVEQLSTSSKFGNNVPFVLCDHVRLIRSDGRGSYLRLEPLMKLDNMRMLHSLQHLHLIVYHLFIALDILLEDDLDSAFALRAVCLADYAICSCAECLSESIFGSGAVV